MSCQKLLLSNLICEMFQPVGSREAEMSSNFWLMLVVVQYTKRYIQAYTHRRKRLLPEERLHRDNLAVWADLVKHVATAEMTAVRW